VRSLPQLIQKPIQINVIERYIAPIGLAADPRIDRRPAGKHLHHVGRPVGSAESRCIMDEVAKASARELIRRLRLAGDQYFDLRSLLFHDINLPASLVDAEYGGIHGDSYFRPIPDQRDIYHLHYFFASDRDAAEIGKYVKLKLSDEERHVQQQRKWKEINARLEALLEDACWLSESWGVQNMPGMEGFDTSKLWISTSTWMWVLFRACWARPTGSILRAVMFYPKELAIRVAARKQAEEKLGYTSGNRRTFAMEQE
jgi:hypothetical protein